MTIELGERALWPIFLQELLHLNGQGFRVMEGIEPPPFPFRSFDLKGAIGINKEQRVIMKSSRNRLNTTMKNSNRLSPRDFQPPLVPLEIGGQLQT